MKIFNFLRKKEEEPILQTMEDLFLTAGLIYHGLPCEITSFASRFGETCAYLKFDETNADKNDWYPVNILLQDNDVIGIEPEEEELAL